MATQHASLEAIEDFLQQKRIAMAGVSRNPASFSVILFKELCRRGYDVVPVNPNTREVQGTRMLRSHAGHSASRGGSLADDCAGSHRSGGERLRRGAYPTGLDVPGYWSRLGQFESGRGLP